MAKITALTRQKRRRDRVNVFLDDEFAFGLQEVVAARLRIGQELDQAAISELRSAEESERAYERALNLLSYRPRSEREIRQRLAKHDVSEDDIESVLERLKRAQFVDDQSFAQFWVENRQTFRPRGAWALRSELRQKGIARDIIDDTLTGINEEANARRAIEKALHRYAHLDEQTFRRRLLSFLQRRGFGYATVKDLVSEYWRQVSDSKPGESNDRNLDET